MTGAALSAVVVGTGFGCRTVIPALRGAGFSVVGLVGADAQRTRRRADAHAVMQAFTDLDSAITQTGAQLIAIATPPHTHGPLTLTAIARGCHVLCEKPFAKNVQEARAMLAAAQSAGIVHMIGHEFRWQPQRALVARAVAQGLIGVPRFFSLVGYMPLVANPEVKMPSWWFDTQSGGGWLGAHGSHLIDQVRSTLGEFASLSATLPRVATRDRGAEDSYVVRFELVDGVEGVLQQTAAAWGPVAGLERIAGTLGTVWIENEIVKVADRGGVRELTVPADLALPSSEEPVNVGLSAYTRLCDTLHARISGSPPASPVPEPTFADGVACMEVIDAIRESAANHGAQISLRTAGCTV